MKFNIRQQSPRSLKSQRFNRTSLVLILMMAVVAVSSTCFLRASGQQESESSRVNAFFRRYEIVTLDPEAVRRGVRRNGRLIFTALGRQFDLELLPVELRVTGYHADQIGVDGLRHPIQVPFPFTYSGRAVGQPGSRVRITIGTDFLEGGIFTSQEDYFIEPLRHYERGTKSTDYIVYKSSDVIQRQPSSCAVTLSDLEGSRGTQGPVNRSAIPSVEKGRPASQVGVHEVAIAIEADYEYVMASGGLANAQNEILSTLNQVDGIYQGLYITFKITSAFYWTTPGEPYTSTDPPTLLAQFRDTLNSIPGAPRDAAHLFTGKDLDGSRIGYGYVATICKDPRQAYALSQKVSNLNQRIAVTAHEIGHNFSATHPDEDGVGGSCDKHIMSSSTGSNVVTSFCYYSREQILRHVDRYSSCLPVVYTPPVLPPDVFEENDSRSSAAAINPGIYPELNVEFDDEDWYRISVPAGKTIFAVSRYPSTDFGYPVFELYRATSSTPVSTSDRHYTKVEDKNSTTAALDYFLRVRVAQFDAHQAVESVYDLNLGVGDCNAAPISFDQTINDSLGVNSCFGPAVGISAYYRRYTFDLPPMRMFAVSVSSRTFDTYARVIGPSGVVTADDDNGGGGTDSRIPAGSGFISRSMGGQYVIEVRSTSNSTIGDFSLSLIGGTTGCSYSLSPATQSVDFGADARTINVTSGSGCGWAAKSNVSWIGIVGGSGSGNGTLNYTVEANPTTLRRVGMIMIDNQNIPVLQAGKP